MIEEKITKGDFLPTDMDEPLRPKSFADFVGQDAVKHNIAVFVEAARMRGKQLDHVILYGPPGLGKTTLAKIIANELGQAIKIISAPSLERQGDLMALLTSLEDHDVLFIDEIHRLRRQLEEILYSAMEDFKVDIVIGEGTGAKTLRISLPPFTLIGATTRMGDLTGPLRSRFGIIERFDYYDVESLEKILSRSAGILGVKITPEGIHEIARRSRGTPRIANRLLKRVADFALVEKQLPVDKVFADYALRRLGVDEKGLDEMDRRILRVIIEQYRGGPVGLSALAASVNEEMETIEDVYEPFLIQQGFVQRTPRGRIAGRLAYDHLGLMCPEEEGWLFRGETK
ncbi:MAG: Holliday junction branch migration DNA helicase RuvB [Brevinematales bacterium]|nr:Holliday junction branch migration DNA helicase RuvB [Brevinematales bacterium]